MIQYIPNYIEHTKEICVKLHKNQYDKIISKYQVIVLLFNDWLLPISALPGNCGQILTSLTKDRAKSHHLTEVVMVSF